MRDGATCSLRARHINFDCAVTHMGICSWSHRHALPVVAAAQAAWGVSDLAIGDDASSYCPLPFCLARLKIRPYQSTEASLYLPVIRRSRWVAVIRRGSLC